jgi:hypothetical protein
MREATRNRHIFKLGLAGLALMPLLLTGCGGTQTPAVTLEEVQTIAEEAYIFSFPILDQYKMLFAMALYPESGAYEAPLNVLGHKTELLGPDYTLIVRPNNDTLYSIAWLDLRAEPMVLSVPAIPLDRYYSFQLIDLYTHNFAYVGSRVTGPEAGNYLITGPGWSGEAPPGITAVIPCETTFATALARTAVFGPPDLPNVAALQAEYAVTPVSEFAGTPPPPAVPAPQFLPYNPEMARSAGFVALLNAFLPYLGQHPSEAELWQRFAAIGIGTDFDLENLDPEIRAAMDAGVATALEKIETEAGSLGSRQNGWMLTEASFGTREAMRGRYLRRAGAAFFGLWGNDIEEAFYPESSVDADGEALDASKHDYVLHFVADQLPPVKSFWSLSMYNLPQQLFIHNPIDRYTLGDHTQGVIYGKDGSLTVYLQHESPGREKEPNWLPAPDGLFSLQMRCYWPEPESLDPLYAPPEVERVEN